MRTSPAKYFLGLFALMSIIASGAPAQREHLQFSTTFSFVPSGTFLSVVGQTQYGNAHLSSDVLIEGQPVHADLEARLEYKGGTGPFSGFITLSWPNGDTLATRYVGGAEQNADQSTTVTGTLAVIGGQGRYAGASGRGTVLGYRTGQLGVPVTYTVTLDIFGSGQPKSVTAAGGQPAPLTGGLATTGAAKDLSTIRLDLPLTGAVGDQWFHTVESGHLRYGVGRLTGQTQGFSVELLAALEYYDGSGPFSGYVTLGFQDGSSLVCRYSGQARLDKSGTTIIDGHLQVFLGTGRYTGARGEGTLRATRSGPIASLLNTSIDLHAQ